MKKVSQIFALSKWKKVSQILALYANHCCKSLIDTNLYSRPWLGIPPEFSGIPRNPGFRTFFAGISSIFYFNRKNCSCPFCEYFFPAINFGMIFRFFSAENHGIPGKLEVCFFCTRNFKNSEWNSQPSSWRNSIRRLLLSIAKTMQFCPYKVININR